jgi:hypothetical protein
MADRGYAFEKQTGQHNFANEKTDHNGRDVDSSKV